LLFKVLVAGMALVWRCLVL